MPEELKDGADVDVLGVHHGLLAPDLLGSHRVLMLEPGVGVGVGVAALGVHPDHVGLVMALRTCPLTGICFNITALDTDALALSYRTSLSCISYTWNSPGHRPWPSWDCLET